MFENYSSTMLDDLKKLCPEQQGKLFHTNKIDTKEKKWAIDTKL